MKFSQQTRDILKNFSAINESIILRAGSRLNTTSNARNVMAVANLPDTFPGDAYIYNLNEFMGTLGLFEDPDIEFTDTHFVISDDSSSMTYYYADSSLIDISDKVPDAAKLTSVLDFVLSDEALSDLLKASTLMQLRNIVLTNVDGDMVMQVTNAENATSNKYGKTLGASSIDADYSFFFRAENMRVSKGDYKVSIYGLNGKYIAKMTHSNMELVYWIALEPSSEINE